MTLGSINSVRLFGNPSLVPCPIRGHLTLLALLSVSVHFQNVGELGQKKTTNFGRGEKYFLPYNFLQIAIGAEPFCSWWL